VQPQIQRQLLDINHSFYERFARQFADSRSTGQASLRRALAAICGEETVLDVGCGDGRVARALDEMGRSISYQGLDASASFIALARERAAALTHVRASFAVVDIAEAHWTRALPQRSFDVALALAVLHHMPGSELRQRIAGDLASLLSPSGRLIVSTWQFLQSERLRKRIVPWATVGLDACQVDEGDYLLDWQRGGYGLRYCHAVVEDQLRALCEQAGLEVEDVFIADGGLNLFALAVHR